LGPVGVMWAMENAIARQTLESTSQKLGGSLHLCFPDQGAMERALAPLTALGWNLEHERPLCATSLGITVAQICTFASALPHEDRIRTRVSFAPDRQAVCAFEDFFDVSNLEALHERCQEWPPSR